MLPYSSMLKNLTIIFSLSIFCGSISFAAPRAWTNDQGQQIEAEFVKQANGKVTLKLKNGRNATIAISTLSQEDQDFLKEQGSTATKPTKDSKESSSITTPDKWPTHVKGPDDIKLRETKTRDGDDKWHTYHSKHFKFSCQTPLSEEAQETVGRLYENTWSAIRAMPLPFPRVKRDGRNLESKLVKNFDEYAKLGGSAGSSGVYRRSSDGEYTMIPYASLNLSEAGELNPSGKIKSHVLAHEITHHLTCDVLADTWCTEGIADYVGYIPYDGEKLDFTGALAAITQTAIQRGGVLDMPYSLEEFLSLSQDDFYDKKNGGTGAARNYLMGCMAVAFFFHLDGERGIKNFTLYMKNAKGGKDKRALKALLNKRKIEELEADMIKAWKAQGVTVKFKGSSS